MSDELSQGYEVELPGGGTITLNDAQEADLWETSMQRYIEDYSITKHNDLVLVGMILTQQIVGFRAQRALANPDPDMKAQQRASLVATVTKSAEAIVELEKTLGLDKKSRDAGGQQTVASYLTNLKRAAHQYGVRIAERVKEYEEFNMELRWRLRLLRNGDEEDRAYHDISPESICEFAERKLAEIEEKDKEWAKTKGKVFLGKL